MTGRGRGALPATPNLVAQFSALVLGRGRGRGRGVSGLPSSQMRSQLPPNFPHGRGRGVSGEVPGPSHSHATPAIGLGHCAGPSARAGSVETNPDPKAPACPHAPQLMHSECTGNPRQTPKGAEGDAVRLTTNFLRIAIKPGCGIFEYHVSFQPQVDSLPKRKQILHSIDQIPKTRTFDGAKLSLPDPLPTSDTTFLAEDSSLGKIRMRVKFVRQLAIEMAVQFYNVLLRRVLELTGLTEINRKQYDGSAVNVIPLPKQYNLEIWRGYDTAADRYEGGLMVCVVTCHRVLAKSTVLDLMNAIKNSTRGRSGSDWKEKFKEAVVGKSILTRYKSAFYRIDDVDLGSNPTATFRLKSGEETSFINYYRTQYNQAVADLSQPLLVSKVKPTAERPEGTGPPRLLVPELCYLTGLTEEIRANYRVMKELADRTRLTPVERLGHIRKFSERLEQCPEAAQLLIQWGLTIDPAPVDVDGRVVEPPRIQFSQTASRLAPRDNEFAQVAARNCYRPVALRRWILLASDADVKVAQVFAECYRGVAHQLRILYTPPEIKIVPAATAAGNYGYRTANQVRTFLRGLRLDELQFVVVLMSQQNDAFYSAVKQELLVSNAVPSQIVLAKTITKNLQGGSLRLIVDSIARQINCKIGGAGWAMELSPELKDARIMFVGLDVYHDPTQRNKSVLALVATKDNGCTRYCSKVAMHTPHQELGASVGVLFLQALQEYVQANSALPTRIVVFRDGISDGQHAHVREFEIPQFKAAMSRMGLRVPEETKFAFIITQKRINERLFNMNCGGNHNPIPGTIVDQTVTRRGEYDFFLVSQNVRHGTVTPTHYYVLEDGGENAPDLMQKITFALMFMYFNWPGSVRVPAVCQYAHKLAYLVGQYLKEPPAAGNESKLFYL